MPKSLFLALLASFALVACDTGDPAESPDALVGTWRLDTTTSHTYVTPAETVTAMDMSQPGVGGIVVNGTPSGTLHYVTGLSGQRQGEDASISLSTFVSGHTYPDGPWMTLHLTRTHGYLTIGEGYTQTQYSAYFWQDPSPVSISRTGVDVTEVLFEGYDPETGGSKVFRVSGSFQVAMRQYTTGVETEVQAAQWPHIQDNVESRFVFETGGVFRSESTEGGRTQSRTGRWEAADGRLRIGLTYTPTMETVTTDYRYRVEDGALSLAYTPSFCPTYCLRNREYSLYLGTGSLASARDEFVYRYTPSTSLSLPASVKPAEDTQATLQRLLTPNLPESLSPGTTTAE